MPKTILLIALCMATPFCAAQVNVTVPGVNVPNPGPNDLTIDGNSATKTVFCKEGSGLFLRGNMNHVQVAGPCTAVHILGNRNVVSIAERTSLVVEGNGNTVHYSDPKTTVSTLGNHNVVTRAGK